jgi:PAS domain S-box-containing protein
MTKFKGLGAKLELNEIFKVSTNLGAIQRTHTESMMKNNNKTREQFLDEIGKLKEKIAELEKFEIEHKQIEEELARIAAEQKNIMATISDGIYMLDMSGNLVNWNKAAEVVSGLSAKELKGKPAVELFAEEDRAAVAEAITKGLKEGIGEVTGSILRKDRTPAIYQWSTVPLKDPQGKVIGLTGVGRDITEQKRAEKALRESETRIKAIYEAAKNVSFIMTGLAGTEAHILEFSPGAEAIFGYRGEEVIGKPVSILHLPEDVAKFPEVIESMRQWKAGFTGESTLVRKSGEKFPAFFTTYPLFDVEGKMTATLGVSIDITERKKAAEALRISEAQKQAILDGITANLAFVNKNLEIIWTNKAAAASVGKTPEEMLGRKCYEFWADPDKPCEDCPTLKAFKTRKPEHTIMVTPDGRVWDESGSPVFDPEGRLIGVIEIARDITVQKQAEDKLQESEEKYRTIFNSIQDVYAEVAIDSTILEISPSILSFAGYTPDEVLGRYLSDFYVYPEQRAELLERLHLDGKLNDYEVILRHKSGRKVPCSFTVKVVADNSGIPVKTVGTMRDITERKQAEEALRESEEKYRQLAETAKDVIMAIDLKGNIKYINQEGINLSGYSKEEILKMNVKDVLPKDKILLSDSNFAKRIAGDKSLFMYEIDFFNKKGDKVPIEIKSSLIAEQGKPFGVLLIARDITERKLAEKLLRESEEKFRNLANLLPQIVYEIDINGNFTFVNKQAFGSFGYSQEDYEKGINVMQTFIPEDIDRAKENIQIILNEKKVVNPEYTALRKDRSTFPILIYSSAIFKDNKPVGLRGIIVDITEQKRREEETRRYENLESIGVLAGGIAHDFNNILTIILGNITLSKMDTNPEDKIYESLVETEKGAMRAKELTQQLLTFSKGGAPVKETSSVAEFLKESAAFTLSGSNVKCIFSIPDDLWAVEIDKGQINQVFNNLVMNADQAMPEGGMLNINAENITITSADILPLQKGKYVKFSFEDHGIGISSHHLDKIFEPYFSTKAKGSGLGLASAYSIIRNHKGLITVESELGVGTTFYIYLPASEKIVVEKKAETGKALFGKGKILIMDDEDFIRKISGEMVKSLGYSAEFAKDGAEAIELYGKALKSEEPFAAVIMDLTIPGGMGGKEAIKELLKIDPNAKVIVSSGYSIDPIMSDCKKYGFMGVVAKPYKISELGNTLKEIILK